MIGLSEILILVLAVFILFGNKEKIGEFARALGKFMAEFKKGKMEAEKEMEKIKNEIKLE